jgi:hypothetical protein
VKVPLSKDCTAIPTGTNCTALDANAFCDGKSGGQPAAEFGDGTNCCCDFGFTYDKKAKACDGGGPPGPHGATCKSASGTDEPPCPAGDDTCCKGQPGAGESCANSKTQECCANGFVCPAGKCSATGCN